MEGGGEKNQDCYESSHIMEKVEGEGGGGGRRGREEGEEGGRRGRREGGGGGGREEGEEGGGGRRGREEGEEGGGGEMRGREEGEEGGRGLVGLFNISTLATQCTTMHATRPLLLRTSSVEIGKKITNLIMIQLISKSFF